MGQPVTFFDITSADADRAKAFYADLFGWTVTTDEGMGGYGLVDTGAGPDALRGGIGPSMAPGDTGVMIYMSVDDLDGYLARAEELGGSRIMEPVDLPADMGRIAIAGDPDGNRVGLWAR